MSGLIKGLGKALWNYTAKPAGNAIVGASDLVAKGVGAVVEPWLKEGTKRIGKTTRLSMIPYPKELGELAKGIDTFWALS